MQLQYLLPHQLKLAIEEGWPLLVPTGCIEYHGPHNALGLDTIIVEELLTRVAERVNCIVAPPFWYGPTGYAVTGPAQGTVDVSTERFGRHVKDVLSSFWEVGFKWIVFGVHHQQMEGPESLAIRQAAAAKPALVDLERLGLGTPWYCTTSDSKARKASIEAGEEMWQAMVEAWVEKIEQLTKPRRPTLDDVTVVGLF